MSIFEDFMLVFSAMTFIVGLIKLIVALVEVLTKKEITAPYAF